METARIIMQIVIALAIVNVWIFRFGKPTAWRGGNARNMQEEFAVYGLPEWSVAVIGFFKLALAALLIVGIWIPALIWPAAIGMAVLMAGAVTMHIKVRDPLKRALPALSLLTLSLLVVAF